MLLFSLLSARFSSVCHLAKPDRRSGDADFSPPRLRLCPHMFASRALCADMVQQKAHSRDYKEASFSFGRREKLPLCCFSDWISSPVVETSSKCVVLQAPATQVSKSKRLTRIHIGGLEPYVWQGESTISLALGSHPRNSDAVIGFLLLIV